MNKTILVIGSVTAKHYESIRLECIAEGNKPKIVRITKLEELFSNDEDLVYHYGSDEGVLEYWTPEFHKVYDQVTLNEHDKIFRELAIKHLAAYGNIDAVMMDESSWDDWGFSDEAVKRVLESRDIKRWVVIKGRTEFVG